MEGIITIIALVFIVAMILRFMPKKGVKYITTKELQPLLEEDNYVFVDVRTEKEYKAAHIPRFINRPLGTYLGELRKSVTELSTLFSVLITLLLFGADFAGTSVTSFLTSG